MIIESIGWRTGKSADGTFHYELHNAKGTISAGYDFATQREASNAARKALALLESQRA